MKVKVCLVVELWASLLDLEGESSVVFYEVRLDVKDDVGLANFVVSPEHPKRNCLQDQGDEKLTSFSMTCD